MDILLDKKDFSSLIKLFSNLKLFRAFQALPFIIVIIDRFIHSIGATEDYIKQIAQKII